MSSNIPRTMTDSPPNHEPMTCFIRCAHCREEKTLESLPTTAFSLKGAGPFVDEKGKTVYYPNTDKGPVCEECYEHRLNQ